MELSNNHFVGFLPQDNRKILGLTDDLNFSFLPLLLNFNLFSLNIINSIKNKYSSYAVIVDFDDKTVLENFSNQGFSERIEQINISPNDQFRFFSTAIIDYINFKKFDDDDYIFFIPCNIDYLWNHKDINLIENFYQIAFENSDTKGIIIKVRFLKELIKRNTIDHFDQFYQIITNTNKNILGIENYFSFHLSNLKEYLEYHLKLFQSQEILIIINSLTNFYSKIDETYISKEAEIINSYLGYNSIIKGKIEDSLIFNDVIILQDVHVQNSIILPGNVISKGVKIKNSIIGLNKNPMKDITIGPNTKIGYSSASNLKNIVYEQELPVGYTLLGNNILLPGAINIGKNCVLRGKINLLELKRMKNLVDGGTFESTNFS